MEICFNTARVVFSLYIYQAWLNSISCFFWLLVTLLIAVLFFFCEEPHPHWETCFALLFSLLSLSLSSTYIYSLYFLKCLIYILYYILLVNFCDMCFLIFAFFLYYLSLVYSWWTLAQYLCLLSDGISFCLRWNRVSMKICLLQTSLSGHHTKLSKRNKIPTLHVWTKMICIIIHN